MKIVFNEIEKTIKNRKKYDKYCKEKCKEGKWKESDTFLELYNAKKSKQCKKIIEEKFNKDDLKNRAISFLYFCEPWLCIGKKENNKNDYIIWGKEKKISIKELKKIMIKNNYKEIELKVAILMMGIRETVANIISE